MKLTAREEEVLADLRMGLSPKEIAAKSDSVASTVRNHVKSICRKMGVRSRGELLAQLKPMSSADRVLLNMISVLREAGFTVTPPFEEPLVSEDCIECGEIECKCPADAETRL